MISDGVFAASVAGLSDLLPRRFSGQISDAEKCVSTNAVLYWVNNRGGVKGLPTDVGEAVSDEDSEAVTSTPAPVQTGLLIYDPMTGDYRVNDT